MRLRCQDEIDKIVATYRDRMSRCIRGDNLLMEEETIAEIHRNLADELNTSLSEIRALLSIATKWFTFWKRCYIAQSVPLCGRKPLSFKGDL